ncbi:hypothetical protein D917_01327 [Trichinella nativa]|uniref:Uncharacterized protein n=1 Tax=Trichinella nativa TaxID=6335 RepID=A0A1Y3ESP3_9BILA|nr:hypothetical protein D917_01327 [Trichinella nativa]
MIPNSTGSSLRQPKKPNNPPNSTVRRGRRFGGRQRNAAGSFSFHLQEMAKNNEVSDILFQNSEEKASRKNVRLLIILTSLSAHKIDQKCFS